MPTPTLSHLSALRDELQRLQSTPLPETQRDVLGQLLGEDATALRAAAAAEDGALAVLDRLNQVLNLVVDDTPEAVADARRQILANVANTGPAGPAPLSLAPLLATGSDALLSELGDWLDALRRGTAEDGAMVDAAIAHWESRAPALFVEEPENSTRLVSATRANIDAAVGDLKLSPLLGSRWPKGG